MTDGTEKCNPKIEENQREDRRAFRKFIVLLLAAMVVGGITGAFSTMAAKEQADIGAGITAGLQKIAPYANLVIAAALAADGVSTVSGFEHVERGYENMVGILKSLGAKVWKITE